MRFRFLLGLLVVNVLLQLTVTPDTTAQEKSQQRPTIVYLRTEFSPWFNVQLDKDGEKINDDSLSTERLSRELVRQAAIISLTDEMGLDVRDETLGEDIPKGVDVIYLTLLERHNLDEKWNVKLYRFDKKHKNQNMYRLWLEKHNWEKTYNHQSTSTTLYQEGARIFENASRNEFVDALKEVGVDAQVRSEQTTELDSMEIKHWREKLLEVDFASQFEVVREVHKAIRQHGESPELLKLLVRGYAQLGLLTGHYYNAVPDVFIARSILYAHRLLGKTDNNESAAMHYAYAFGLAGLQNSALGQLERMEEGQIDESDVEKSVEENEPWLQLVRPYLSWDREALREIAENDANLNHWALRLSFQITDDYRYESDVREGYAELVKVIPYDYGIYDSLFHNPSLSSIRTAARAGVWALAKELPASIENMDSAPKKVVDATDPVDDSATATIAVPRNVAIALRKTSKKDYVSTMSWSALANCIEEEQFILAARYMLSAVNATQYSHDAEVDGFLPLVEGHRYAPFIESFRYYNNVGDNYEKRRKILEEIKTFPDARGNMWQMQRNLNYVLERKGRWSCKIYSGYTGRATIENCFPSGATSWRPSEEKIAIGEGDRIRIFMPKSSLGTRMNATATKNPPLKQIRSWEQTLKHDSLGLSRVARHYENLGMQEEAINCFEKSLHLRDSIRVRRTLMNLYFENEDYDKWEATGQEILKSREGLAASDAAAQFAYQLGLLSRWEDALPVARQAAGVWSYRGLDGAASVTERLALWEESERWAKEASIRYPATGGNLWYLWCRRNGRGDLDGASVLAQKYYARKTNERTRAPSIDRGVYYLMEEDYQRALEEYKIANSFYPSLSCTCMTVHLARKLGEDDLAQATIEDYQQAISEKEELKPGEKLGQLIVKLLKSDVVDPQLLEQMNPLFSKVDGPSAAMYTYVIGQELLRRGEKEGAEKYFRQAFLTRNWEFFYTTLAGFELAKLNDVARPDEDSQEGVEPWPEKAIEDS